MNVSEVKKLLSRTLSAFDAKDLPVVVFLVGLALLCYGAESIRPGGGFLLVGFLLVLYVRPLKGWW